MTTLASTSPSQGPMGWLHRAEAWLDARGRGAWLVALVLAFVFVWPVGLALLAYMIWSKKMFCSKTSRVGRSHRSMHMTRSTGNTAFDTYRDETLRRLQEEQENFEAFLNRLRQAKDKAQFDQFMDERARAARSDDAPKET